MKGGNPPDPQSDTTRANPKLPWGAFKFKNTERVADEYLVFQSILTLSGRRWKGLSWCRASVWRHWLKQELAVTARVASITHTAQSNPAHLAKSLIFVCFKRLVGGPQSMRGSWWLLRLKLHSPFYVNIWTSRVEASSLIITSNIIATKCNIHAKHYNVSMKQLR